MCRDRDEMQTHTSTLITHMQRCVCLFTILTSLLSVMPDFSSLEIKRYQLWLSLSSMSAWQSPIHICQMQWAESNRSPIMHREPCKALETVDLNSTHWVTWRPIWLNRQSALRHVHMHQSAQMQKRTPCWGATHLLFFPWWEVWQDLRWREG